MKNRLLILIALVLLIAGTAMADGNKSDGTAADAKSDASADVKVKVDASDHSSSVSQRQFISAFPGTGSFLFSGIPIDGGGWQMYCPPVYKKLSVKEVESMKRKFQLSDLWPWNWGSRIRTVRKKEGLPANGDDISCTYYWPKAFAHPGDDVLSIVRIMGEPNWPDEAYLGMAESACKTESGSRRVAMRARIHKDGVTVGSSIGLGGATAKVVGGGDEGVAFAAGGQLGTNRTRVEDYVELEALCLNDGPTDPNPNWFPKPEKEKPASVPEAKAPAPPTGLNVCDEKPILKRIEELVQKIKECTQFCFANLGFRRALGDAYVDMYVCTGDREYLHEAIKQYQIAERNYKQGHDISAHKAEADRIIAQVYYNWAGCIRESLGRDAAMVFARSKNLERIPTGFATTQ